MSVDAGSLTEEQAQEIVDDFVIKGLLRNELYNLEVARYAVAGARLYSDGNEGETSGNGAALVACAGHLE
jgi:hypothetical protein